MGAKPRNKVAQKLFEACKRGQIQAIRWLLQNGANVNYLDAQGNTPLMVAAWEGHGNLVDLLIKCGAVVNGKNRFGFTALVLAVHYQREAIVKRLLLSGADVNETYETQGALLKNPLVVAGYHDNISIAQLLIKHGADLAVASSRGKLVRDYLLDSDNFAIRSLVDSAKK